MRKLRVGLSRKAASRAARRSYANFTMRYFAADIDSFLYYYLNGKEALDDARIVKVDSLEGCVTHAADLAAIDFAGIGLGIPRAGAIYIKERVLSVAFAAASVALWIGWSGEWLQDIIGGIAFGYLFCVTIRVMKQTGALTPAWWRGIWTGLALLGFLEAMTFFVPQRIRGIFELAGYILMAATMVLLLLKAVILAAKKTEPRQQVAISFAGFVWSMSCMYMSSGGWYLSAMIMGTLALPLMLNALKKEVAV